MNAIQKIKKLGYVVKIEEGSLFSYSIKEPFVSKISGETRLIEIAMGCGVNKSTISEKALTNVYENLKVDINKH